MMYNAYDLLTGPTTFPFCMHLLIHPGFAYSGSIRAIVMHPSTRYLFIHLFLNLPLLKLQVFIPYRVRGSFLPRCYILLFRLDASKEEEQR